MSVLGDGFVQIRPLLSQAFGSELGALLSNPLSGLEGSFAQKLGQGLTNSISGVAQSFGVGAEAADAFGASVVAVVPPVVAAGVAVGAAVTVVKGLADAFEGAALPVLQFQRISGASAEDASRLVAVLGEFGIATQGAGTAILRMDNNVQIHEQNLQALGVVTRGTNGAILQGIPLLENVATAYSQATDQATRTDLIVQTFGTRIGTQLLPLLAQGKVGLEQLFAGVPRGLVFDQAQLQQAQDFQVAVNHLGESFKGLEVEAGSHLVPTLTRVVDGLDNLVNGFDNAKGAALAFISPIAGSSVAVDALAAVVSPLGTLLYGLGSAHKAAASAAQEQIDAENALTKATDAAEKGLEAYVSAQDAYDQVLQTVTDDQAKVNDLTSQIANLQLNSASSADLFAHNMQALNAANDQVASSTQRVAQAQKALNDILHPTAESVGKAHLAVAEAQNNLAESQQSVVTAQRAINDLEAVSVNSPQLVDARLRLTSAQLGVQQATFAVTDAQQQLHDIENPTTTDAYTQAQQNLQSALDARTAAVQRAEDAQKVVDGEQAARLAELKTKTDELHTAQNKLTKDQAGEGIAAIHAFNAETALQQELTAGVNTQLAAEIQLIEQLYTAAASSLDQLLAKLNSFNANLPPSPNSGLNAALGPVSGLPGAPTPTPNSSPATGSAAIRGAVGAAGAGYTLNIYPAQGMSETQVGHAAASAIAWAVGG